MKWTVLPVLFVAVLIVGCGSDGSANVLHLEGGDISLADYRQYVRVQMTETDASALCSSLRGLTPEEGESIVFAAQGEGSIARAQPRGWTPVAGQDSDRDSRVAAVNVVMEECERISG